MNRCRIPVSPFQIISEVWISQPTAEITFKILYAESIKDIQPGIKEFHKFTIMDVNGRNIDHVKTRTDTGTEHAILTRREFVNIIQTLLKTEPYFIDDDPDTLLCSTKASSKFMFYKITL